MISSLAVAPSSSWVTSSSPAVVRVEKATSEFLTGPDWTMNIDICDLINANHWVAKDVLRAVRKRLLHKNPKVQLLSLTLLETMVKNCADVVHVQIAERNILPEMVKIVKKTMDTHVKDKILVLLDSWQEAFGGSGGKYPQYYWAYQELRNAGVGFPPRSYSTAPILTPPLVQRQPQLEYGMSSNSSTRLDGAMEAEMESLSVSTVCSMRSVLDLLAEMLQAVNPGDRDAVKDEIIVDLVDRCRANQKKLIHMLTATVDEGLLAQGLELNDILQSVLAKLDVIASGTVLPDQVTDIKHPSTESRGTVKDDTSNTEPDNKSLVPVTVTESHLDQEENGNEEDDFAQLAQRHSKTSPEAFQTGDGEPLDPSMTGALVVIDPPSPTETTTKEQDIIELLSITLSSSMSPDTPETPTENINQTLNSSPFNQGNPHAPESYPAYQSQAFNGYIAPWAQPQPQPQPQMQYYSQPQFQQMPQLNGQFYYQSQFPQYSGYATAPWAATPGYFSHQNSSYAYSTPQTATNPSTPLAASSPYFSGINGNAQVGVGATTSPTSAGGQKPSFVPSYRLFEDLNVFGKAATTGNPNSSSGLYGANSQSIGGRK